MSKIDTEKFIVSMIQQLKDGHPLRINILYALLNQGLIYTGDSIVRIVNKKEGKSLEEAITNEPVISREPDIDIDALSKHEIGNLLEIEKQGEQKPADKVEPKFKVGDWVVRNGKTLQISGIDTVLDGTFHYWFTKGTWLSSKKMENAMLWTIQDAKDGDVLVDKSDGTIGIFQSIGHHPGGGSYNDPSYCFLHCRYDDGFFYADFENGNTMDSDDAIPATKEQRDTLEKAMADAGYTFDFEKRELKKIEQKHTDVRTTGYWHVEDVEQKPAWSEEDNIILSRIIADYERSNEEWFNAQKSLPHGRKITWLKSLKDRVQPKQEWSKEDDRMKDCIIKDLIHPWYSKIPDSTEDEINWLKSLRPPYYCDNCKLKKSIQGWKPSEEQIECLSNLIEYKRRWESSHALDVLSGLLEQLKKLTE